MDLKRRMKRICQLSIFAQVLITAVAISPDLQKEGRRMKRICQLSIFAQVLITAVAISPDLQKEGRRMKRICQLSIFAQVLITAVAISPDLQKEGSTGTVRKIPESIQLGVATAAYQIEGGWNAADKSLSIWDVYSQVPGAIADNTTGNDACKSYEFYQRDIEMVKFLGVDFYRFSISWPRLFPNGFTNKISEDGKRYYNSMINDLLAIGIEPVVTMYHWDLPQSLQDLGGWTNPLIVEWFEDYARGLYTLFGDRVKTWITINEPKQIGIYGYGQKRFAPALNALGIGDYLAVKHLLLAHATAWHIYDKEFREKQKGICGITIATDYREGASDDPEDIEAGHMAMDFEVGLYAHPIFTSKGGFPERVIKRVAERSKEQGFLKSRLPELSEEEIEFIKGTSDFYGFNHYSTKFYTPYTRGTFAIPSYEDDMGGLGGYLDYPPATIIHSTSIPPGIRKALNWVKENCNNPRIMITENGYSTLAGVDDEDRIEYFRNYLTNVLDAKEIDGCNVVTYTAWSLMDNYEWNSGLSIKFGLFEVDYEDDMRKRTARSSALWYRHLLKSRTLDLDYTPEFENISF